MSQKRSPEQVKTTSSEKLLNFRATIRELWLCVPILCCAHNLFSAIEGVRACLGGSPSIKHKGSGSVAGHCCFYWGSQHSAWRRETQTWKGKPKSALRILCKGSLSSRRCLLVPSRQQNQVCAWTTGNANLQCKRHSFIAWRFIQGPCPRTWPHP
jgi:hypothetical protein